MVPSDTIRLGSSDISQAALDALPDAFFWLDEPLTSLRPLNAAARALVATQEERAADSPPLLAVRCLPELELAALPAAPDHAWLTH